MTSTDLIAALDLPHWSRVDQRVPKKLLLENGAPTSADKRYINDGIDELCWVAALKPTTIGVPEYRDAVREYLEIAILRLTLRSGSRVARLTELVHRAVPYPVLLIAEDSGRVLVSAAHIRWSQGEVGKTVLDGEVIATGIDSVRDADQWLACRDALALGRQPRATLYALYQGWIDTMLAFRAACITGEFGMPVNAGHATARRDALRECARLEVEIARLRAAAAKENQIPRQVELNLEIKRVEARLASDRERL